MKLPIRSTSNEFNDLVDEWIVSRLRVIAKNDHEKIECFDDLWALLVLSGETDHILEKNCVDLLSKCLCMDNFLLGKGNGWNSDISTDILQRLLLGFNRLQHCLIMYCLNKSSQTDEKHIIALKHLLTHRIKYAFHFSWSRAITDILLSEDNMSNLLLSVLYDSLRDLNNITTKETDNHTLSMLESLKELFCNPSLIGSFESSALYRLFDALVLKVCDDFDSSEYAEAVIDLAQSMIEVCYDSLASTSHKYWNTTFLVTEQLSRRFHLFGAFLLGSMLPALMEFYTLWSLPTRIKFHAVFTTISTNCIGSSHDLSIRPPFSLDEFCLCNILSALETSSFLSQSQSWKHTGYFQPIAFIDKSEVDLSSLESSQGLLLWHLPRLVESFLQRATSEIELKEQFEYAISSLSIHVAEVFRTERRCFIRFVLSMQGVQEDIELEYLELLNNNASINLDDGNNNSNDQRKRQKANALSKSTVSPELLWAWSSRPFESHFEGYANRQAASSIAGLLHLCWERVFISFCLAFQFDMLCRYADATCEKCFVAWSVIVAQASIADNIARQIEYLTSSRPPGFLKVLKNVGFARECLENISQFVNSEGMYKAVSFILDFSHDRAENEGKRLTLPELLRFSGPIEIILEHVYSVTMKYSKSKSEINTTFYHSNVPHTSASSSSLYSSASSESLVASLSTLNKSFLRHLPLLLVELEIARVNINYIKSTSANFSTSTFSETPFFNRLAASTVLGSRARLEDFKLLALSGLYLLFNLLISTSSSNEDGMTMSDTIDSVIIDISEGFSHLLSIANDRSDISPHATAVPASAPASPPPFASISVVFEAAITIEDFPTLDKMPQSMPNSDDAAATMAEVYKAIERLVVIQRDSAIALAGFNVLDRLLQLMATRAASSPATAAAVAIPRERLASLAWRSLRHILTNHSIVADRLDREHSDSSRLAKALVSFSLQAPSSFPVEETHALLRSVLLSSQFFARMQQSDDANARVLQKLWSVWWVNERPANRVYGAFLLVQQVFQYFLITDCDGSYAGRDSDGVDEGERDRDRETADMETQTASSSALSSLSHRRVIFPCITAHTRGFHLLLSVALLPSLLSEASDSTAVALAAMLAVWLFRLLCDSMCSLDELRFDSLRRLSPVVCSAAKALVEAMDRALERARGPESGCESGTAGELLLLDEKALLWLLSLAIYLQRYAELFQALTVSKRLGALQSSLLLFMEHIADFAESRGVGDLLDVVAADNLGRQKEQVELLEGLREYLVAQRGAFGCSSADLREEEKCLFESLDRKESSAGDTGKESGSSGAGWGLYSAPTPSSVHAASSIKPSYYLSSDVEEEDDEDGSVFSSDEDFI